METEHRCGSNATSRQHYRRTKDVIPLGCEGDTAERFARGVCLDPGGCPLGGGCEGAAPL